MKLVMAEAKDRYVRNYGVFDRDEHKNFTNMLIATLNTQERYRRGDDLQHCGLVHGRMKLRHH